ncbi:dUTP diphosphatase [Ruminococcus champanellensis]|uniref:Deoxyuridine 5'-triphosphate nucleotidohydrolase n=1 Tax=Ruminococcus champanellensis (strain DSM 18848 / JCM 17042 / KCTC 15320 / 18P13) TaxID=213810 RepID=D4LB28_RUMC1|nr:dUTP diphosphatase [Ruminococcus champanellensis]CBL16823.1 deoxyuridine 5'-triphosphate nucleotidohydrolase [Ruminococcus champanellensis 18P13 = JCM 17042]
MKLQIMRLRPEAILPEQQTPGSAGYDLSACLTEDLVIEPGDCVPVSTGIALCPDRQDVVLLVYARSGLATKHGVSMANGVGVIDSDYRGEVLVPLVNRGREPFRITPGMRIAQLVVTPVLLPRTEEVQQLPDSARGAGGFGSTGA